MLQYSFNNSSPFYHLLKQKVDHYFSSHNLHRAGNTPLYSKAIVQVLFATALYIILVFFTPPVWISILLCVLLGLNLAVIGFNIMHEGGHQAFSKYSWINSVSAYFLNVLGGNTYYWKIKHNVNHHTFTNIEGMDSDIDVKPFMRLHKDQPLHKYHRFQHIYWILLYGISYIAWVFYEDFQKYATGKISDNTPQKRIPFKEHAIFWATKLLYVTFYVIIPILTVGWLFWLIGFLIITFVCGVAISIVFQLAHVVEGTEFHIVNNQNKQDWAVHQVVSTANFATSNRLLHWLLGGLNFQIEHHLFPRVSHIHYPAISRFVKETCQEFNITYHEYKTMRTALVSHLVHLRKLGNSIS